MVLKKLFREGQKTNWSCSKTEAILALREQVCCLLWEVIKGQATVNQSLALYTKNIYACNLTHLLAQ